MEGLRLVKKHESVAVYCRVSSDKQSKEGTIESQVSQVLKYCEEAGYEISAEQIYKDEGYSGSTLERPGLDALRDKANHGVIDKVVILDPDRLARKSTHQLLLSEELKKLSVSLEFVNRQLGDNPEDRLLFNMQGIIAEFEREKIIERTRRGKIYKAKNGQVSVMSRAPYGYRYVRKQEGKEARYEVLIEEAEIVKIIFNLFTDEGYSIRKIVQELHKRGIPSYRGNKSWCTSAIWEMLLNPIYCGKAAYGKRKAVERKKATKLARDNNFYPKTPHSSQIRTNKDSWIYINAPKIISLEQFDRAQLRLEENKTFSARNRKKNRYLLAGLVRCEICDYAIIGSCSRRPPAQDRFYYRCQGIDGCRFIDKKKVCSGRPIRCEVLDELVWDQIKKLLQDPSLVLKEYNSRMLSLSNFENTLEHSIEKQQKLITQYEHEKSRLIKIYQSGHVSLDEIQSNLEQIKVKIKTSQSEIVFLESEKNHKNQFMTLVTKLSTFMYELNSNLDSLDFDKKLKIVRLLVQDIVVNSITGNIKIRHVIPDYSLNGCHLRSSRLSDLSRTTKKNHFSGVEVFFEERGEVAGR